jgi:hypothetical protein
MARWSANPITIYDSHRLNFVTITGQILMAVHGGLGGRYPGSSRQPVPSVLGLGGEGQLLGPGTESGGMRYSCPRRPDPAWPRG